MHALRTFSFACAADLLFERAADLFFTGTHSFYITDDRVGRAVYSALPTKTKKQKQKKTQKNSPIEAIVLLVACRKGNIRSGTRK